MTGFKKRVERALAALGPLPQKMTFVYEDGEQVEVVGFLAAARQNSKRGGLVDILGTTEGQKNFFMCAQGDIRALWDDGVGGKDDEQVNAQSDPAGRQTNLPVAGTRLPAKKAVRPPKRRFAQRKKGRRS